MKPQLLVLLLLLVCISCSPKKQEQPTTTKGLIVRSDFKKYFDSCSATGTIAIYDYAKQQWVVSDTVGLYLQTLPASTFKIINLLIALETKTIADENEVAQWVGSIDTAKYGVRPEIYHTMSVKEAFELSAGWVFVELAKKIGRETYKKYLTECHYGNGNLSEEGADFWNFGPFAISPKNQVEFLRALYEEKLPFSKRNIDIVKRVMVTGQSADYILRSKTGWSRIQDTNMGWWVGYIEIGKAPYFFATRLIQDRKLGRKDFGNCRKDITWKVFKDLGIIQEQ